MLSRICAASGRPIELPLARAASCLLFVNVYYPRLTCSKHLLNARARLVPCHPAAAPLTTAQQQQACLFLQQQTLLSQQQLTFLSLQQQTFLSTTTDTRTRLPAHDTCTPLAAASATLVH